MHISHISTSRSEQIRAIYNLVQMLQIRKSFLNNMKNKTKNKIESIEVHIMSFNPLIGTAYKLSLPFLIANFIIINLYNVFIKYPQ